MSWYIIAPLIAISLGHWSLLLHGMYFAFHLLLSC